MRRAQRINRLFVESKSLLKETKWDNALEINQCILRLIEKWGLDGKAKAGALTNIGLIQFQKGEIEKSISTLEKALELKKKIGDKKFLVTTLMNLARSYRAYGKCEDAIDNLRAVHAISKELNDAVLEKEVDDEIALTEKMKTERKGIKLIISTPPGVSITHVATGGESSWRSPSMEKVKSASPCDVETVLSFDLPFPLSRLPEGTYEMKENSHTIRFVLRKVKRKAETAKDLTGWVPEGDLEIIGDRFGRISFSHLEIRIPYRVTEPMFDYLCPNCKVEVEENATECLVCHHAFGPEEAKRPSTLHSVKIKAVELLNQFLSIYRFIFKDFFIDYVRYQDVISYGTGYRMKDGTQVEWAEDFSTTGEMVKGDTLIASEDDVCLFKDILSRRRETRLRISDQLLSSAENRISTEEFRLAILEALMAFEGVLSEYVLTKGYPLIMSQNPKLKKNDRYSNAKRYNRWRFLTPKTEDVWGVISSRMEQADPSVLTGCKWAIEKRNDIVHDQLLDVEYNDAKKTLWYIKSMMEYVDRL